MGDHVILVGAILPRKCRLYVDHVRRLSVKGVLVYKDRSGTVWGITQVADEFEAFVMSDPQGPNFREDTIENVLGEIDLGPEWTRAIPSKPVQQDQLDRGAFPNEGD